MYSNVLLIIFQALDLLETKIKCYQGELARVSRDKVLLQQR